MRKCEGNNGFPEVPGGLFKRRGGPAARGTERGEGDRWRTWEMRGKREV